MPSCACLINVVPDGKVVVVVVRDDSAEILKLADCLDGFGSCQEGNSVCL